MLYEVITKLKNLKDASGVIFDGFPRTTFQAQALKAMLEKLNTGITVMLSITVSDDELIQRLLHRGAQCGRSDDNLETRITSYNVCYTKLLRFLNRRYQ